MSHVDNLKTVSGLEPTTVWEIFAGIADVPRPSHREESIRRHVHDWAAAHGLPSREDEVGNVLVEVPASEGREGAPIVVLQGHLDMVPEKNSGTVHDFDNDPIRLVLDSDSATNLPIVRADGTTLGADNGMGVAMAMAAAIDPAVIHGPLELIFTADEEDGMTGAKALQAGFLAGKMMLNLDTEEDDSIYIGCAGGCDSNITLDYPWGALPATAVEQVLVKVSGLRGGHSGGDIHENRGNAIKILVRSLSHLSVEGLHISDIRGGSKRNAIPREASALVAGPAGTLQAIRESAQIVRSLALTESPENDLVIAADDHRCAAEHGWLSVDDTQRALRCLAGLPHGVLGMSMAIPGLVETSNCLSTVSCTKTGSHLQIAIGTLSRSSNESCIKNACQQIEAVAMLAGGSVTTANEYPGWDPNPDSALLRTAVRVYEELYGQEPAVEAVHAGLECGIIGERVPGMDMISIGPTITGAHSPDEQVFVDSVTKSWDYLKALLDVLSQPA